MLLTIRRERIRRTRRRAARAHLRRIARRVRRGPAHLRRRRKLAGIRTTLTAVRVADGVGGEFACGGVAAGGGVAFAWIAVLAGFDDTVPAHVE